MEKVDNKLQMKKDMQKLLKENDEDTNGRTKQTNIIMKDQRESTIMLDKKLREMTERIYKQELADSTFKHNLMGDMKEQNQKIVSSKDYSKNCKRKEKRKLLLPNLREKEFVSSARTLGIMLHQRHPSLRPGFLERHRTLGG